MKKVLLSILVIGMLLTSAVFAFSPVNNSATMLPKGHMYISGGLFHGLDNYFVDYSLGFTNKMNLHTKIYGTGLEATMENYFKKIKEFHMSYSYGINAYKPISNRKSYAFGIVGLWNVTYAVASNVDLYFGPKIDLYYRNLGYNTAMNGIQFDMRAFLGVQVDLPKKWAMFMEIQPWFNGGSLSYAGVSYFFGNDVVVNLK